MKTKPQLIETIRIQNGRVRNISYHNQRCNYSRKKLFGCTSKLDLRKAIDTSRIQDPEVKCRVIYDEVVLKVEYEPYLLKKIHSLKLVEIENYTYSFKYTDRTQLSHFFNQRGDKDDVLMTRNGFITDTYYANVALYKDGNWYTPEHPLLKGSQRARLLEKGILKARKIHKKQLNEYESVCIFNAMIPFKKLTIDFCKSSNLIE